MLADKAAILLELIFSQTQCKPRFHIGVRVTL
jgi:hypothetical protein